jgi:hypothetical protein
MYNYKTCPTFRWFWKYNPAHAVAWRAHTSLTAKCENPFNYILFWSHKLPATNDTQKHKNQYVIKQKYNSWEELYTFYG